MEPTDKFNETIQNLDTKRAPLLKKEDESRISLTKENSRTLIKEEIKVLMQWAYNNLEDNL